MILLSLLHLEKLLILYYQHLIKQALRDHKEVYPHHCSFVLQSDGAGAYAGYGLMSRLGYMGIVTGIKIVNHYTGESGGGKSSVDQVFGICKEELKRRVTLGMGSLDISDAVSLAKALNYKDIKKTINYAVTFMRADVKEPAQTKTSRDAKLQSHSTRSFEYNTDGMPTKVCIEEQSYLPESGPQKYVVLEGLWAGVDFPYAQIIPQAIKLESCADSTRSIPGPAELKNATSVYVSRLDKEAAIMERKIEYNAKLSANKEVEVERKRYWENKAMRHAQCCGVKLMVLCSDAGCVRQFTSHGRLRQHEINDTHQSNGNPLSQSSKPVKPTEWDNYTIRELAAAYLRDLSVGIDRAGQDDEMPQMIDVTNNYVAICSTPMFGWARRVQLRHPGFSPTMSEFLKWIFRRGNEKGNSKCSAGAMRQLATMYGKSSELYDNDSFWKEAIQRSGGVRIFSDAEIPEEWQVKQFICQASTTVKQKQKATAGVQALSPDDMRLHLMMHLQDIPNLPGDLGVLTNDILCLAIDLSVLKQMDILKLTGKKGIYNQLHRRAIVAACKLVGRQAPKSLLVSVPQVATDDGSVITPVGHDGNDDLGDAIVDEEEQQDIYDAEHNNDDEEIED